MQITWNLIWGCHIINYTNEYKVFITTDRLWCFVLELSTIVDFDMQKKYNAEQ